MERFGVSVAIIALGVAGVARAADQPRQAPVPAEARRAIADTRFTDAYRVVEPAVDACLAADPGHGSCIDLLNALAIAASRTAEPQTEQRAAKLAAEAAATYAPGTELEYGALAALESAMQDSDTPLAAEAPGRRALALAEKLWGPDSDQAAILTRNLATLMTRLARHAEAEALMRRARAIRVRTSGADSLTSLDYTRVLGVTLNEGGKVREGIGLLTASADGLAARYPDRLLERALAEGDLAAALHGAGRYQDAKARYAAAYELWARYDQPSAQMLTMLNNAAVNFSSMGEPESAVRLYRTVVQLGVSVYGADHPTMAVYYGNLGVALRAIDREGEALSYLRRALAIATATYGPDHIKTAPYRGFLAWLLPPAEAERERRALVDIYRAALGPAHPTTQFEMFRLAGLLMSQRRFAEAEPIYRECVALGERTFGADNVNYADSLVQLALSLAYQLKPGSLPEMKALFDRAWRIQRAALGPAHADTIETGAYVVAMSDGDRALAVSRITQSGVLARAAQRRDFDASAQRDLRNWSLVFAQGVALDWKLANPKPVARE
ncbi:tetratricopeptide repeat protein [Sphingomonas sp.]|uniref:tetratricopeptide repeat protein n=1 Tax=Sphingomonas sp. TaxID=28214 RepID=UPI001ECD68C9|nr:tetratricopeptide repeat protein [Sphingomonas sp.]MBX3594269.1 tetratricopeptide repeat protein [Sphingomonas sp.]